jgi:hypothetical protein
MKEVKQLKGEYKCKVEVACEHRGPRKGVGQPFMCNAPGGECDKVTAIPSVQTKSDGSKTKKE